MSRAAEEDVAPGGDVFHGDGRPTDQSRDLAAEMRGGSTRVDTVVVGGGVSGLATAYFLKQLDPDADVVVLETTGHVGGKVRTPQVAGLPVDTGPDSYLSRAPELGHLIEALGLGDDVIGPLGGGSYIYSRGKLRPIPPGMAFGLPERLWPLLRSGLLTPTETARAGFDLVLPTSRLPQDPTVADLIRPRFGRGVYDRLAAPLLGGVHAGDPAQLSATSTVPDIAGLARKGRSLTLTMRRQRRAMPPPTGPRKPPLVSIRGGLSRLTGRLREEVGTVQPDVTVRRVEQRDGRYAVHTDRASYDADTVVLATPAYVTADLLEALDDDLATTLREIPYVDVANATLAFPRDHVPPLPPGTGFLVPPVEQELIVGCTWLTQKWPHLAGTDHVLIKSMVGRAGDTRWLSMSDEELVAAVRASLGRMLGITADPVEVHVQRWPQAMPQYAVGHAALLGRIDDRLTHHQGLALTGAAYRGVGLAGCVAQAHATATALTSRGVPA